MKTIFVKVGLSLLLVSFMVSTVDAQRTSRRQREKRAENQNPDENTAPDEVSNNNNNAPTYNPAISIPFTYDTANNNAVPKPSLRNDNAFDKGSLRERTPLAYEHLRWDDALFAEKVWRELDLREKMNQTFRYDAEDDNGSQLFLNILLKSVENGDVTAFADDRFSTPLSLQEIQMKTAGGFDTVDRVDINDPSKIVARVVTKKIFNPNSVVKLRLKEEWVFDREASRLFCRILGIAPLETKYNPDGSERGSSVMFWIYYPDLRSTLTKYEV
nr:gliding motility protein GldN [Chitinophagaceae bacterium]